MRSKSVHGRKKPKKRVKKSKKNKTSNSKNDLGKKRGEKSVVDDLPYECCTFDLEEDERARTIFGLYQSDNFRTYIVGVTVLPPDHDDISPMDAEFPSPRKTKSKMDDDEEDPFGRSPPDAPWITF